jgi:hypothetical protein
MPDVSVNQISAGTMPTPPLPTKRPITSDVVTIIKEEMKNHPPYSTGHASVNEIKDINDAFFKAPKTVANKVISELSDKELSRLATEVYGKTAGLSASEKTQLNKDLSQKLDATQYTRMRNTLKQGHKADLKEMTSNRFKLENNKWDFNALSSNYQRTQPMLNSLTFNKTNKDAILDIGGGTCAVRLSNAFNRAGYIATMDQAHLNTNTSTMGGKNNVSGIETRHVMGAHKLATHLGVVENGKIISDISEIKDKIGIIYFDNAHIDLWQGDEMVGNGALEPESELNNKTMYFLELK